jgi:hypothetical protein
MTPDETPPKEASRGRLDDFDALHRPRRRGRHILFAGVAGACVLGAGLGLWARPGLNERQIAVVAREPEEPALAPGERQLKIVVDDHPAPLGAPIQVLPTAGKPAAEPLRLAMAQPAPLAPPIAATPVASAPASPRQDAMRVQAATSPAPPATPPRPLIKPVMAKLAPLVLAALAEARREEARLTAPKVEVAKAAPPAPPVHRTPPSHRAPEPAAPTRMASSERQVELAEAAAARAATAQKAQAHRLELAKAARAEKLRLAQAEKLEATRQARADKVRADKAEAIRLAKAEAKGRAEARADARAEALAEAKEEAQKQIRLASLVRTIRRALPHETRPPAPARTARLDHKHAKPPRHEPTVQQTSLKGHKASHIAQPPSRSRPPILALPPALMKVSTPRCASRDPGEALVCADPSLGAADRQLARAYQGARAAGVPDAQLQRQQQRWLAARAAAAREAPWAVRDVYLARIAELNGLAHDAHGDGY